RFVTRRIAPHHVVAVQRVDHVFEHQRPGRLRLGGWPQRDHPAPLVRSRVVRARVVRSRRARRSLVRTGPRGEEVLPAGLRRFRPGRRGRGSAGVTRARLVGGEGVEARRGGGGQVGGAGTGPLGLRRIGVGRGSGRPVAARGGAHVRFAGGARVVGGARDGTGPGRVTGPALGRSAPADRGGVRGAVGTGVGGG